VVFQKNQSQRVVIFLSIYRKISKKADFGRTYPPIICYRDH